MIVSAEIFPRKKAKNPTNSIAGEAGARETSPPKTSVPAPSSNIDASSRRIGGIAVLPLLRQDEAERTADEPADARERERQGVGLVAAALHQVLRVEREGEQPEPPELVPQHLERREAERGRRARRRSPSARDMLRMTWLASRPNVVSCGCRSPRGAMPLRDHRAPRPGRRRRPPRRSTRERGARAERERDAHDLEQRAAGLREAVALQQVLARHDVGDRGRLHRERHAHAPLDDRAAPTIRATVAPTLPSDVALPSGSITATATIDDDDRGDRCSSSSGPARRSNRSMNTPMNGEITTCTGT